MDTNIGLDYCILPILLIVSISTVIMVRNQKLKNRNIHPIVYFIIFLAVALIAWFIVFRIIGIPGEYVITR